MQIKLAWLVGWLGGWLVKGRTKAGAVVTVAMCTDNCALRV